METNELIKEIREALADAEAKLELSEPAEAVFIGDKLYDTIFTQTNIIRRDFKDQPEIIQLCEVSCFLLP